MLRPNLRLGSSALVLALVAMGCSVGCGGTSGAVEPGSGGDDTGGSDGSSFEGGSDGGGDTSDSASSDTGNDGAPDETGSLDSGLPDTGADDTGIADTGADDTGADDTGTPDTGGTDTGATDAGPTDGGALDPCSGAGLCTIDTDKDTIPDSVEGRCAAPPTDTDKDGVPDYLSIDSDSDKIKDAVEWAAGGCDASAPLNDADGDGVPNFRDLDSDANGLLDLSEACPPAGMPGFPSGCTYAKPADFDGDGVLDFLDSENDHDSSSIDKTIGLEDKFELTDSTGKYVGLVDSDKDFIPDLWDRDSDGDQIYDLDDGLGDPDKDGIPNFRDVDSDDDGVKDWCEARANAFPTTADLPKALRDTNGDGTPDYLQRDTDGDLLLDGTGIKGDPSRGEDANGNCLVDGTETDRLKADTDGDGVSDFIEVSLVDVACAKDPTCTPAKSGLFYFVEPYSPDGSLKPTPTSSPLALSTTLNKGDLGFIVDTTGSMSGEIANLKSSLSSTIIPALKAKIPSLGLGFAGHDDFPYGFHGGGGDLPYYYTTSTGFITTDTTTAIAAANSIFNKFGGSDGPESQTVAVYKAVSGEAITWPTGSVPADSPPVGTFGAMHFRTDALPIVAEVTDANFHNGRIALDKTGTSYDGLHDTYEFPTFDIDNAVAKFNALGAKFIGIDADNGSRTLGSPGFSPYTPYGDEAYLADKTGSTVPASSFGGACGAGMCCTGVSGAAVAPDGPGGSCRLVFSINTSGTGLGTSIVDGVSAILASIKFDTYVQAYNDPAATIDVVGDFMLKVEPQPTGGTDPVTGGVCVTFPASQLDDRWNGPKALIAGVDGVFDTIKLVNPGSLYCFNVVPRPNTSIVATKSPQIFTAWLKVLAAKPSGGTFTLGTDRKVLFLVPPQTN